MWQGNALMSSYQNVDIVRLYHNGVCYMEHDAGTVRTVHYGH